MGEVVLFKPRDADPNRAVSQGPAAVAMLPGAAARMPIWIAGSALPRIRRLAILCELGAGRVSRRSIVAEIDRMTAALPAALRESVRQELLRFAERVATELRSVGAEVFDTGSRGGAA